VAFAPPASSGDVCSAYFANGSLKMCYDMLAGQYIPAGHACVEIINSATDTLKITYDMTSSAACLKSVHAYIGDSIPVNNAGNPAPGNFPMTDDPSGTCVKTYTFTTSLPTDCSSDRTFANKISKLAAHASVQFTDGNGGQTAWSVGKDIKAGGSWATYSEVNWSCSCGSGPVAAPVKAPTKAPTKVC
jgi:hypothetical protein